jgi:hypothetical protein
MQIYRSISSRMAYRSLTFFLPHWWAIPLILSYNRNHEAYLRDQMLIELRRKNILNDIRYIPYIYKTSMRDFDGRSSQDVTLLRHTNITNLCRDIQYLKKIYKPKRNDNTELVRRE